MINSRASMLVDPSGLYSIEALVIIILYCINEKLTILYE